MAGHALTSHGAGEHVRLGCHDFPAGRLLVMAVINRTPDSYYAKGRHYSLSNALSAVDLAVADGANIVDIRGCQACAGSRDACLWRRSNVSFSFINEIAGHTQRSSSASTPGLRWQRRAPKRARTSAMTPGVATIPLLQRSRAAMVAVSSVPPLRLEQSLHRRISEPPRDGETRGNVGRDLALRLDGGPCFSCAQCQGGSPRYRYGKCRDGKKLPLIAKRATS